MDKKEIDKYLDILGGDDRSDAEKFEMANFFIDRLLGALQDAEAALETYRSVPSQGTYYYYVAYAHEEGYGCTQIEMNRPIMGGMDILDMIKIVQGEGVGLPIILNWIELDHL